MQDSRPVESAFLEQITKKIEDNISNEQFGVSELANEIGMSRSNLLRKIKKLTNLSASQFIRQVRLENAMEMIRESSYTISEVSYKVGFSSASYFIKCFREHYGFSPGEVNKQSEKPSKQEEASGRKRNHTLLISSLVALLTIIVLLIIFNPFSKEQEPLEKSIAVLPFKNESNDSTNVYLINGLMESVLNNLQQIEDLRVISRTSVEKYRNNPKTISELTKELNVNYFVEGSGQKVGDQILLNVQLIEAPTDNHLWAEQYNRKVEDIFQLQMDVAKTIATEIEAIITPEEEELISKPPTDNLEAYEQFLKGLEAMNKVSLEGLVEGIPHMEKAIELDASFARPYAALALAYYYLDLFQVEKKYTEQINDYADKALLNDSKLAQALIAKGYYYMTTDRHRQALPYFEKALEYNPNSGMALNTLSDYYTNYEPNTEKYLGYALKGLSINKAVNDSSSTSFTYLHLANAFVQTGFFDEAEFYINRSLDYNPANLFSEYVKAYILYTKNGNLNLTRELLIEAWKKDTTRLDIMQEVANISYYMRDFKSAYVYYKKFLSIKEALKLDIFHHINGQIGMVFQKMGYPEEAQTYFKYFKYFAESDNSIYRNLHLSTVYIQEGNMEKSLEHLRLFAEEDDYFYWILPFVPIDPFWDDIKDHPEFKKVMKKLETKFWKRHKRIKKSLEEDGLLPVVN